MPRIGLCSSGYRPIGELLIDIGAITYPDLVDALPEAAQCGKGLGEYLLVNGRVREEQIANAVTRQGARDQKAMEAVDLAGTMREMVDRALPEAGRVAEAD